ncbi:hypothetical protein [Parasphingopyxis marina]|uniref:Lipoprotein n=1 Tax=Parasphingopyxis marina TaxID=2761622 RepID=A0A842HV42_9SPHN|nr:hypothetical protein [Parasphingopyxis marina]MBC2777878.1 hypothetical protein [Parasphingopyxis marina]
MGFSNREKSGVSPMKIRISGFVLAAALTLPACSDGLTAEEEIAQIEAGREAAANQQASPQARYDRAVECAATALNVSNVFDVIASTHDDGDPARAAQARSGAQDNLAQARIFVGLAEQIAADPGIGKSRDAVLADIDVVDRRIRQRGSSAEDFTTFVTQIASESDQCDAERASLQ